MSGPRFWSLQCRVSDVLKYIWCTFVWQSYFYNDDTFNFNYAQAKAAVGNYKEAEEVGYQFYIVKKLHFLNPWQKLNEPVPFQSGSGNG